MNKIIITTNQYIKHMPFYNPQNILIIDRDNPQIDLDFLKSKSIQTIHPEIKKLRIDYWVKQILE